MTLWQAYDEYLRVPTNRPLLVYVPKYCVSGYCVAVYANCKFKTEFGNDVTSFVKDWALFMEADE